MFTTKAQAEVALLKQQLRAADHRIDELNAQVSYWRTRAEKLMDAALARRGEINEPTMRDAPPPPQNDLAAMISGAFAITEFASESKGPHADAPR